jgi:hypothetical protein
MEQKETIVGGMDTTDLLQDREQWPEYGNETSCAAECVENSGYVLRE